jgi:hypothetical protein
MQIRAVRAEKNTVARFRMASRPVWFFFPVLLFLFHAGLSASDTKSAQPAAAPVPGGASAFEPVSVKEIGPLLVTVRSSFPVIGQAGNYSMRLEGGRSLWFLNNIWTGEIKEKGEAALWGIVDGAVSVLETTSPYAAAGAFRYVADENKWPLPLLSVDISEYASVRKFWPRAGVRTPAGFYVYYSLMNNFGPGGGDYFRVGQGLAVSETPTGPYKPVKHLERYAFWNDIEPSFGSALWADRDGWLYVYGRYMTEPGKAAVAAARVRPENMAVRSGYSYYSQESSSGSWTSDITDLTPVMENVPDEFSVTYNEHLKAYLAICSDPETGEAAARTAQYPWGPWDAPRKILACGKEDYCFGAKEQPVFSAEGGQKIFFTLEKKNMPYLYELALK